MRFAVTTSRDADAGTLERGRERANQWGVPFLPRRRRPLEALLEAEADVLLVLALDGVELCDREGRFRFTPGMAALRVLRLEQGRAGNLDRVVEAAELRPGDAVLDCTLGAGQDAWVFARAVGERGRVVGVEASLPLFAVVSEGLAQAALPLGAARIEAVHDDALSYLRRQRDGSFDVVYFDPMFDQPRRANPAFEVVRRYARGEALQRAHLDEGLRVARRSVVVKGARRSAQWAALGLRPLEGSRYADVVFARAGKASR